MNQISRILAAVLGVAVVAAATYYFVFVYPMSKVPPPVLGQVQSFALTDMHGQPFTEQNLKGKIWVADLIFTTCTTTCPMLTRKMKNVYLSYELEDKVNFVSVSVDPVNDTPEVLQKYAQDNKIKAGKWHILTGAMEDIRKLATESLKLAAVDVPGLHSDRFVLVDSQMRIRGYYDPKENSSMQQLFHELALVLQEESQHDS